ncbi:MAG: Histidine kinase, gyrase and HSP90-like ATPase [Dactylosporangium sp.]|jgi:hypothetical protein|nr:Histidine kinase, gyrase and HSP90-like ATPase [Dactylosporangium sp.]
MAQRLDPTVTETAARHIADAPAPPPAQEDRVQNVWPAICEQFALRILAAAYQMGSHLEAAEADEQDEDRLEKLYRIDHANTRIRRQAENLQVLLGRKVDDAGRQVTSLVDVIRAATSAIEYYPRVHIGQVVDLAVVEFAADDVIRVLTELLDNATRFSPPTSSVIVSAYITEHGSVLVRVEDSGVGVQPDQLPALNAMLAGSAPPALDGNPAAHLGLVVVARLALAHHMRVHLTSRQSGGTTANVLVPDGLLCEIAPPARTGAGPAPLANLSRPTKPAHRLSDPGGMYQGSAQVPGSRLTLINGQPATAGGRTGRREPGSGNGGGSGNGLPRRVRESLRGDSGAANGAGIPPQPRTSPESGLDRNVWPDETADFAAGISDAQWSDPNERSEGNL